MRTVTFIFALSFLTTLGWRVHSTLSDWTTSLRVDLSPITKTISIIESQSFKQKENVFVAEIQDDSNYFSKIESKIAKEIKVTKKKVFQTLKVVALKVQKQKFGLPENKFENLQYKINYKEQVTYQYIAFVYKTEKENLIATKDADQIEQVVKMAAAKSQAAPEKTSPGISNDELEEDIEIFEYSQPDVVVNPLMNTQKTDISQNVDQAIKREMKQTEGKPAVKGSGSMGPAISQVVTKTEAPKIKIDFTPESQTAPVGPLAMNNSNPRPTTSTIKSENNLVSTHEILLRTGRVDFTGSEMSIQRFELIPFDDENEILSSDSEGILKLQMREGQSRLVSVRSEGHLATNFKASVETSETMIPMIAQTEFENILNRFKLSGEGAFLAVQLDDEIKNVELDKPIEAKLFLDRDFKIVAQDKNPQFVLFIGVAPGNTMIGYDFSNQKKINKIIYLTENEVYFENEEFSRNANYNFSLYSKELMSQGKTALNVNSETVASFNDHQESKKLTLNAYGFKDIVSVRNETNYFELRLSDLNLFFTAANNAEIELPSKTYYNEILSQFNLSKLQESCVVQLNLNKSKKLDQLKFNGRSYQGFENIELLALDDDGSLGSEVSDTTRKIFLTGNAQGVMNLKLKYTDSTTDYLQTYCSPGIYLVEHL